MESTLISFTSNNHSTSSVLHYQTNENSNFSVSSLLIAKLAFSKFPPLFVYPHEQTAGTFTRTVIEFDGPNISPLICKRPHSSEKVTVFSIVAWIILRFVSRLKLLFEIGLFKYLVICSPIATIISITSSFETLFSTTNPKYAKLSRLLNLSFS